MDGRKPALFEIGNRRETGVRDWFLRLRFTHYRSWFRASSLIGSISILFQRPTSALSIRRSAGGDGKSLRQGFGDRVRRGDRGG